MPPASPSAGDAVPGESNSEFAQAARIKAQLVAAGLVFGQDECQDTVWHEAIQMMASWKSMLLQRPDRDASDFGRQLTALVTDQVMVELVGANLWSSPWIEVAEREFPGIQYDQVAADAFLAELPERIERERRIEQITILQPAAMLAFLQAVDYPIDQRDIDLIMSLCARHLAVQFMSAALGQDHEEFDLDAVYASIFAGASLPHHAVWDAFVKHFYSAGTGGAK